MIKLLTALTLALSLSSCAVLDLIPECTPTVDCATDHDTSRENYGGGDGGDNDGNG